VFCVVFICVGLRTSADNSSCPGRDLGSPTFPAPSAARRLYEQGRAIYEKGGLNLDNLTDEQQIEAEDDYRICARRGNNEVAKSKKR
jgi:hypothetical protein